MGSWTLVRFSLEEVRDGVATRLLRDFMSLALDDLREIGVFSSEVDFQGKCLYFSPCAAKAFASVLAKVPIELCDPPHPETLLCLYGAADCLPIPGQPVGCPTATGPSVAGRSSSLQASHYVVAVHCVLCKRTTDRNRNDSERRRKIGRRFHLFRPGRLAEKIYRWLIMHTSEALEAAALSGKLDHHR